MVHKKGTKRDDQMRIFFGSGILLLLFFKSMILKNIFAWKKVYKSQKTHVNKKQHLHSALKKKKKKIIGGSPCAMLTCSRVGSHYIYILMSKEQLLVYSYYSCRAHNIIHYSCKCVQQVHMIPYNFVHMEYKLYNIQLLCKFAITLRATFSYLDNNFHLPFIKSIESCFSIIKITKQFFFLQKMIFFFLSTNQTCF